MDKLESIFGIKWTEVNQFLMKSGMKLLVALAILMIGFWVTKMIYKGIQKIMNKSELDPGLTSFISSLTSTILKILVVITALGQLGIEMTSFIALLGAAGLAIGMAFSGTLGNLAGGIMILFFKPFKAGDTVEAQGAVGVIKEIHIFNTILMTADNRTVLIPNGPLANGNIINYTHEGIRRVDLSFGFNYGGDYDQVKKVIEDIIGKDDRILNEPAPLVAFGSLGDSSVNVTVRPWVNVEHYWPVHFDMNEKIYKEFAKHNIGIPFPQMDVHVIKEN